MKENQPVFASKTPLKSEGLLNKAFAYLKQRPRLEGLIAYCFLSVFILALFAVFLASNSIFPFGKGTMSSYDMLAQVAPYIEHFFDVFDGKSSLFYSYAVAGGADLFGTLAYCCVSPFTFLFLIFGKGNVYYATAIVLPLKVKGPWSRYPLYIIYRKFPFRKQARAR